MTREYVVFLKGKKILEVSSKSRLDAVREAKNWFYGQIEKGKIEKGVRVRKVLSVSDPYKEVGFLPRFNTNLDAHNFLKPEDIKRIINSSDGALAKAKGKEGDSGQGHLRQLVRTNQKSFSDSSKVKKLNSLPYIHYSRVGTLFYAIRKYSANDKPTTRYIKLESQNLGDIIDEIRDRRLVRQDESSHAKEKFKLLTQCIYAISNLQRALSYFSFRGLSSISFHHQPSLEDSVKIIGGKIYYNPKLGGFGDISSLNAKIRKAILEYAS